MHVIHLRSTSKNVPVSSYVAGVKTAIANPDETYKHGLETWWPVTGSEIRREFRNAMQGRINAKAQGYGQGRKWRDDWQRAARRVAHNLNGQRILTRERECPIELRARLSHRLHDEWES